DTSAFMPILPGIDGIVFGNSPSNSTAIFEPLHILRLHGGIMTNASTGCAWETPTSGMCCLALAETELHVNNGRFKTSTNMTTAWLDNLLGL
ncbi:MAG: hypothetical protein ACKPKO_31090, partial [Candidatus Fonsibacter sp.]